MKKIIGSAVFGVVVIIQIACSDSSKGDNKPKLPCIDNLDSSIFDLTVLENQRINIITNKVKGSLTRTSITPDSPDYSALLISNDGKSITKMTRDKVSPPRTLRINKDTMFFGDDISLIINCSSTSFKILSYGNDIDMQDSTVTGMWGTYVKR